MNNYDISKIVVKGKTYYADQVDKIVESEPRGAGDSHYFDIINGDRKIRVFSHKVIKVEYKDNTLVRW